MTCVRRTRVLWKRNELGYCDVVFLKDFILFRNRSGDDDKNGGKNVDSDGNVGNYYSKDNECHY